MNKIEELKKLKSLLDQGAISEEEFTLLKKQILDIQDDTNQFEQTIKQEELYTPEKYNVPDETSKETSNTSSQSNDMQQGISPKKSKANAWAIFIAGIAAISVFLPWVEASSSVSFAGYHGAWSSGGISGIQIGYGVFGLLMSLVGGGIAFTGNKWASIFGFINCIDGIGYIAGWFNLNGNMSYNTSYGSGNVHAGVHPQFGIILFIIASLFFALVALSKNAD